jgi:hypothetical protein
MIEKIRGKKNSFAFFTIFFRVQYDVVHALEDIAEYDSRIGELGPEP